MPLGTPKYHWRGTPTATPDNSTHLKTTRQISLQFLHESYLVIGDDENRRQKLGRQLRARVSNAAALETSFVLPRMPEGMLVYYLLLNDHPA